LANATAREVRVGSIADDSFASRTTFAADTTACGQDRDRTDLGTPRVACGRNATTARAMRRRTTVIANAR
jgi:hypothetical protein